MISGVFIDRPRLAIVISIVITLAGLVGLTRLPVAQFPDIVSPQVSVQATYPGASAAVVEASVAQPIEAQVVGVDKMIYMRSYSGNDGSYNLTVSFLLGTNPDVNTVNVLNRVQTATPELPAEVQAEGTTVQKRSSAILELNVQTTGRLSTTKEFGDIVLRANADGSVLRIADVARVEIGAQNLDSEARLDDSASVPLAIYLAPGANALSTANAVNSKLAQLARRFPQGLAYNPCRSWRSWSRSAWWSTTPSWWSRTSSASWKKIRRCRRRTRPSSR